MEINNMELLSIKNIIIERVTEGISSSASDTLSVEEPLEIRIIYGPLQKRVQKNISVTMRTPGNDFELAAGFLFTEGIISTYKDIAEIYHAKTECLSQKQNIVQVELNESFIPVLKGTDRNFYTTSSCGVCGKGSIESIKTVSAFRSVKETPMYISVGTIYNLPKKLNSAQSDFAATGGLHASGLFTTNGDLVLLREDVGRHNALDKLIGLALQNNSLPLNQHILLLSGRASFELIQKAAMAGISIVAAIGAPSSLAVELAAEFNITLLGFVKQNRFNIYNSNDSTVISTS